MDEPSTSNPLLQPPQNGKKMTKNQQKKQQKKKALAAYKNKMKWKEPAPETFVMPPPREKTGPVRESAKINLLAYMHSKGYYGHEVEQVGNHCRGVVSVLEDICPRPLRLGPYNYPKTYLLRDKHVPMVKKFLMNRNSETSPRVVGVVEVDGYALVLCINESSVDYVRGLLPQMAEEDMGLKELSKEDIQKFNSTRGERCDFNILIKYRKHGMKWKRRAWEARQAEQRELEKAAASSNSNVPQFDPSVPPPFDPNVPPPPLPKILPG